MKGITRLTRSVSTQRYLYPSYNHSVKIRWAEGSSTRLNRHDLIFPVFVSSNPSCFVALDHLPMNYKVGLDTIISYLRPLVNKGLSSVLLFGSMDEDHKDLSGSRADSKDNPVIMAVPEIKREFPDLCVICDVCLCAYTSNSQCYIEKDGDIDIEATVERLVRVAVNYVKSGCDIVAPSDVIDGRIGAIKSASLKISVMSYASKFSSCFYGPFRLACGSHQAPSTRRNQLPVGSNSLAVRAIERDIDEGADYIIVKPGLHGLDLLNTARHLYPNHPRFAYQVSGECAMLHYAAEAGAVNFYPSLQETLITFKRAGATGVITYFVPQVLDNLMD